MPFWLFGTPVLSKVVQFSSPNAGATADIQESRDAVLIVNDKAETVILLDSTWPSSMRHDAYVAVVNALSHNAASMLSFSIRGIGAIIATLVVVYLLMFQITSGGAAAQKGAQNPVAHTAPQSFTPEPAARLSAAESLEMSSGPAAKAAMEREGATLAMNTAIAQAQKVVLRPTVKGGKGIIVWSDPLCPHCREFEANVIASLPATIGVTIIPVSFQEGSKPVVSYVLCGKDGGDISSRWSNMMLREPVGNLSLQCAEGPRNADANSILFTRSGLTSTPTIQSADGTRTYPSSSATATVDSVAGWARL